MSSPLDRHLHYIFMLPSKLIAKFRGWIYGYTSLLLGMVCLSFYLFGVFIFIFYLAIRGVYGFLINLKCIQTSGCDDDDDLSDLNTLYAEYQPGKRKSFLTRCREQTEQLQQALCKDKIADKSSYGITNGNVIVPQENGHHNSLNNNGSHHGHLVRNYSYASDW